MGTPISVPEAYIETFNNNVVHLAQQTMSRLRQSVETVNRQSQSHNWDFLGKSQAREKTSARMVSPSGGDQSGAVGTDFGLDWTRRKSLIRTFDTGEIIEPENIVQMLIDPKSATTKNLVMNMQRQVDDIIIGPATGATYGGLFGASRASDGSAIPFDDGLRQIDNSLGLISLDNIMEALNRLLAEDVDPDEYKSLVIGPNQWHVLMKQLELTSSDFTAGQPINSGKLPNVLGVNEIIISNRLNANEAIGSAVDCALYCKSGMGLHIAGDIAANAAERPDMSFAWQCYMKLHMDSIRLEDEKVYKITVKDGIV